MIFYDASRQVYRSDKIDDSVCIAGFSTKSIGDAKKKKDLHEFFRAQDITYKTIVIPLQIHSSRIKIIDSNLNHTIEIEEDTDALVTGMSNITLTVVSADCSSTLYFDSTSGIIAISHQGWKGTVKNIGRKTIETMVRHGANRKKIHCILGPSIGECCYEIYGSRYEIFQQQFSRFEKDIFSTASEKQYLNLTKLNYLLLQEAGVLPEHIDYFPFCTKCNVEKFYSYQRDHTSKRILSFIMKK